MDEKNLNMGDLMKEAIFARLADKYNANLITGRWNRLNGYEAMAHDGMHQNYGIESAVAALGYDVTEFNDYARELRRQARARVEAAE